MISTSRVTKILTEQDEEKRNKLIEKLTEEDAKYILKVWLKTLHRGESMGL